MVRKRYRNLFVPQQLYQELEHFVAESKGLYMSVAEVVIEAVREFLERRRTIPKRPLPGPCPTGGNIRRQRERILRAEKGSLR